MECQPKDGLRKEVFVTDTIKQFVLRLIQTKGRLPEDLDTDSFNYIDSGHVDSMGIKKFVVALESEFYIEISEADMESAEFRTVGGVVAIVRRRIDSSGGESAPARKEHSITFSIVIPAYNTEDFIENCLCSVLNQSLERQHFEVILVDDCSTDSTFQIASRLAATNKNLLPTRTAGNSGPGIARNVGVAKASGAWVLFLDSDDFLHREALTKLKAYVDANDDGSLDAVGFNWVYAAEGVDFEQPPKRARRDHGSLGLAKSELIKEYLSLHMDGGVIYTATRRELILENNLQFEHGFHEDVDYIFKIYWFARKVSYLNEVLYFKTQRSDSIVNTISPQHIEGFMRAWKEIGTFVVAKEPGKWDEYLPYYKAGLIGVVATRVREVCRLYSRKEQVAELCLTLYRGLEDCLSSIDDRIEPTSKTKYNLIASNFMENMRNGALTLESKADAVLEYMKGVMDKSWSCIDLHHSAFLAPSQIRTCCKRFFVDGEMRGDVVLVDESQGDSTGPTSANILEAKQELVRKINSGEESDCDGCPFLRFEEWGPLEKLDIRYLSLEYHSICNLKCSYCCDTYYGGMQPKYDVTALVSSLLEEGALESSCAVVWGGGEPSIHKSFAPLAEELVNRLPGGSQRIITNAVTHSETIERLLREDRATITTSIDAGTDETFLLMRGRCKLREVLANLEKYASANSSNVTIKYLFTEVNSSLAEVSAFISLVQDAGLMGCNYQISTDFKQATISIDAAISAIAMHGLLIDAGCRLVYFDDLLRQRLDETHSGSEGLIKAKLSEVGLRHVLADKADYRSVAIWGAGWQAKYLLEKTSFFRHVDVEFFVDSTPSMIGGRFRDRDIFDPRVLLDSDIPVAIAAVQGSPIIYDAFLALGIDESRLIKELIL